MGVQIVPLNPTVRAARDFLVLPREDLASASAGFSWPDLPLYNFATDWFDGLAEEHPDLTALWVIEAQPDGSQSSLADAPSGALGAESKLTFRQLADRSVAVASFLAASGLRRGDRLLLVLGNCVPLWEVMLAAIRLGAVVIPATPQLSPADLADRVDRGDARLLIAHSADAAKFASVSANCVRVGLGEPVDGWLDYADADAHTGAEPHFPGTTRGDDQLLLYFTSGTTAQPKLVQHSAVSYPIGHLSTLYWMGLKPARPGPDGIWTNDVHLNISSPGWAKHAWSNLFAPWLAGATVLVFNYSRFVPAELLTVLVSAEVNTFCAPPTVWRMLVQSDLGQVVPADTGLRELLSAGEPLNPEVIEHVRRAWGITIRDGYGQTETSAQIGNPPGCVIKPGSMGRPLSGYQIVLVDPVSGETSGMPSAERGATQEGELCLSLDPRPVPLMSGYKHSADAFDDELNAHAFAGGVYHTGDVVQRDEDGYITFVGRADDVFKASDYRISPFELESVLIEHPAVAEAAIVPAPDAVRLAVPKAYVVLAAGYPPDADTARSILTYARRQLAPYKRIRRLQFAELPKTISGKIRRVELRTAETEHAGSRPEGEYRDSDFQL
ncbi:MAG: AMP-binding protein [Propionibacteriaceae bacterium]